MLKSGKEACPGYRVAVDSFERQVSDEVLGWIFSVEHVRALLKAVRKALKERSLPLKELRRIVRGKSVTQRAMGYDSC